MLVERFDGIGGMGSAEESILCDLSYKSWVVKKQEMIDFVR